MFCFNNINIDRCDSINNTCNSINNNIYNYMKINRYNLINIDTNNEYVEKENANIFKSNNKYAKKKKI